MLQWYEEHCKFIELEIEAMKRFYPDATYGFLPDKRMYWKVKICPFIRGERKEWMVLAVYSSDYPSKDSFRFYPVSPSYSEMTEIVRLSEVTPKIVPHLFRDNNQLICFDIASANDVLSKNGVESVVPGIARVARWIYHFEIGLGDPKVWKMFCGI